MNKKSIWACLLGLSIPAFVVSCADLRDADVCYRAARLWCQKSCATDEAQCISQMKSRCQNDSSFDEKAYTDCSDKLAELADCAGPDAVTQACAASPSTPSGAQYGASCQDSSSCPVGGSCQGNVCVHTCSADFQCSGVTISGESTYCDDTFVCSPPCQSSTDCSGTLICHDEGNGHKSCRTDGSNTMPQPTTQAGLAQDCDVDDDCDSTSGLTCDNGFCSKTCRSNADCGTSASIAICALANGALPNYCTVPCSTSSCDAGQSCSSVMTTTGASVKACHAPNATTVTSKTLLGGACKLTSDCQDPSLTCQQGICTKTCTSDVQCSSQSATGMGARCGLLQPGSGLCLAACAIASDNCDIGTSCLQVSTSAGLTTYLCRPDQAPTAAGGGNVGDACVGNTDCNQKQALVCSLGMCTKACSGGLCPAASSPESSVCVGSTYCSVTCLDRPCPMGWTCRLDTGSGANVCQR